MNVMGSLAFCIHASSLPTCPWPEVQLPAVHEECVIWLGWRVHRDRHEIWSFLGDLNLPAGAGGPGSWNIKSKRWRRMHWWLCVWVFLNYYFWLLSPEGALPHQVFLFLIILLPFSMAETEMSTVAGTPVNMRHGHRFAQGTGLLLHIGHGEHRTQERDTQSPGYCGCHYLWEHQSIERKD